MSAPAAGLDYGAGPGPALARMFEEGGYTMSLYDPFFHPSVNVLAQKYDFITATEVAEHFHDPMREFERMRALLVPGGVVVIMTQLLTPAIDFASWYYKNDPTHVVFYSKRTFQWLQSRLGFRTVTVIEPRLAIFEL